MMLRKRQREFVDNCSTPLKARKNTLGIAPTGAGKTIMMAAMCVENAPKDLPSLVLQHRDELVDQNLKKFVKYAGPNNIRRPMRIDASSKVWDRQPKGWNFGMIQTIVRNLEAMPKLGMLAIDEAHHAAADSYLQLIAKARHDNPDILIYGTTATPNRGDKKALRMVFDNCGDNIPIKDLIRDGHLVRPRTYIVHTGVEEQIKQIKQVGQLADNEVAKLLNTEAIVDKAIQIWINGDEKSGVPSCRDRPTIVFCSNTEHGKAVTDRFLHYGIRAEFIGDRVSTTERREILKRYDSGETEVLVNVYILTEGFDHQPTSCVMLLKRESFKSTMTQMIGRGLRKVDPEIYPGVVKDDCIVLDFGTSCSTHGSLEDEPDLEGRGIKMCPSCQSDVPQNCRECGICGHEFPADIIKICPDCNKEHTRNVSVCDGCGHVFPRSEGGSASTGLVSGENINFVMSEMDILQDSPFKYESFYNGRVMICFGFNTWAAVIHYRDMRYYSIGAEGFGDNSYKIHILGSSDNYLMALQSADDYMRTNGTKTEARKVTKWLYEAATMKQIDILSSGTTMDIVINSSGMGMNKYRAACGIQFKFYGAQMRAAIERYINVSQERKKAYAHG